MEQVSKEVEQLIEMLLDEGFTEDEVYTILSEVDGYNIAKELLTEDINENWITPDQKSEWRKAYPHFTDEHFATSAGFQSKAKEVIGNMRKRGLSPGDYGGSNMIHNHLVGLYKKQFKEEVEQPSISDYLQHLHELNEAKKVKLTPRMSKKDYEAAKKAAIEKAKKPKTTVVKKKEEKNEVKNSDKNRLDWFNDNKQLRSWLSANVHPADKERVMNDIWNAPKAVEKANSYMSGKEQYRKA